MKNSPSSRPLNGSTSASSSCRNSESASSTPARNAPSDIDRPIASIRSAAPITTSSAARGEDFAAAEARDELEQRDGPARRLTTMTSTIAATPFAASIHRVRVRRCVSGAEQRQQRDERNHGEILEQQDRERAAPARAAQFAALPSHASTIAVDDIASPKPDDDRRLPRRVRSQMRDAGQHDSRHERPARHPVRTRGVAAPTGATARAPVRSGTAAARRRFPRSRASLPRRAISPRPHGPMIAPAAR